MQDVHNTPPKRRLTVFLNDGLLTRLDAWRRAQANPPTRGMALRMLAERQMKTEEHHPLDPKGWHVRESVPGATHDL